MGSTTGKYTAFGFVTIAIWGTSAAFTRNLSTGLGAYAAAALVNIIGGILVLARQVASGTGLRGWRKAPLAYWLVCGLLFIVYTATSYVTVGSSVGEEAVVTIVLIKFLWPLFTLLFAILILKEKASAWLAGGVLVSLVGIAAAKLGDKILDFPNFVQNLKSGGPDDLLMFLLGFVVAISWALYTNLTKKFVGDSEVDGVGIYMVASGVVLGAIAIKVGEPMRFSAGIVAQMLYAAIVVSSLANLLWTLSIKKGNMILVVLASNFLPIISTIMAAVMLGVAVTLPVIVGSALVVAGTLWSKRCFDKG
jgi:drug/metabolite transporter (DMT)-like permease